MARTTAVDRRAARAEVRGRMGARAAATGQAVDQAKAPVEGVRPGNLDLQIASGRHRHRRAKPLGQRNDRVIEGRHEPGILPRPIQKPGVRRECYHVGKRVQVPGESSVNVGQRE